MTVVKLCARSALLLLVILGWSGIARADYLQFGPLEAVSTVYITTTPAYGGYNNLDVYDGQYNSYISANPSFTPEQAFNTFCVDLKDEVNVGQQYVVQLQSTSIGLTNGPQIAYLYDSYGVATINSGGSYSESWGMSNTASGSGAEFAAGLQLAIWDLLANNGATSGNLSYSGESANTDNFVSFFLYQATSNTGYAQWANSNVPQGDYTIGQSFLVPAALIPAPEPSTLTLVGIGLACLAACRARRARRAL